jgi:hypothetical protein
MPKQKLLEDIKQRPGRFYRIPSDVMRDRRFDDTERLEILRAWRAEADETMAGPIEGAIGEVEGRLAAHPLAGHAAE